MTDTDKIREHIEEKVSPYFERITDTGSRISEIVERRYYDELLLTAILEELKSLNGRSDTEGDDDDVAPYYSFRTTISGEGQVIERVDFTTDEIDIRRFTENIEVYGSDAPFDGGKVEYDDTDEPVVGMPMETDVIYIANKGNSETEVEVQLWG